MQLGLICFVGSRKRGWPGTESNRRPFQGRRSAEAALKSTDVTECEGFYRTRFGMTFFSVFRLHVRIVRLGTRFKLIGMSSVGWCVPEGKTDFSILLASIWVSECLDWHPSKAQRNLDKPCALSQRRLEHGSTREPETAPADIRERMFRATHRPPRILLRHRRLY